LPAHTQPPKWGGFFVGQAKTGGDLYMALPRSERLISEITASDATRTSIVRIAGILRVAEHDLSGELVSSYPIREKDSEIYGIRPNNPKKVVLFEA
jgi:hypothetical protein